MKIAILYLGLLAALFWKFYHKWREDQEPEDDFDYLTVREQLAVANDTAQTIAVAERLITDMEISTPDDVMAVRLEWLGRDDQEHSIDIYCDGSDTETENLICIGERIVHDLQAELSHQCAVLSTAQRHRQNKRQIRDIKREGGVNIDQIVSEMRCKYLNG